MVWERYLSDREIRQKENRDLKQRILMSAASVVLVAASWQSTAKRGDRAITSDGLLQTIRVLASDEYEGRAPGTAGEEKTVAYLIGQCKKLGLKPGNPDGTYVQNVALWGVRSSGEMTVEGETLRRGEDYLAWSIKPEPEVAITGSELVFAGYGIKAPDRKWDDYAGVDVRGKTVVLLAGDPFGGALTIHGRSYTKAETAFAQGAVALLTVNIPRAGRAAGLGAMAQNVTRENMILRDAGSVQRVAAQGALTLDKARELIPGFDGLRESAGKAGFRAVASGRKASFRLKNELRRIDSKNVVGKIQGASSSEMVIYSGHWDHLGRDGDKIYHGASDNAAGTAGVLELAKAFLKVRPKRTVLFMWPTAEEKGLLGAKWYVQYPLYPLKDTVANINLDYFSNWGWGRTRDFSVLGLGGTTLEDYAVEVLKRQGRVLTGDTAPAEGFYFRSDHFEFAKGGVPAMEMSPGIEYLGRPAGWGAEKREEYIRQDYHKVSDEVKADWDLSGAVEDLQVLFEVGYRVSMEKERPGWKVRPF